MHLHLIRHGQTDWNAIRRIQGQTDSHLDERGIEQAQALGRSLASVPFRRAYISSAARTRETADELLRGRSVERCFRDDLREMRLGRWESHRWPDVERDEPDEVARYVAFDDDFQVDGAERLSQMQRRGLDAIDDIVRLERADGAQADDHVAVVSHGFLLRAILARYFGLPLGAFAGSAGLPNCAHCQVLVDADRFTVETVASQPPGESLWSEVLSRATTVD